MKREGRKEKKRTPSGGDSNMGARLFWITESGTYSHTLCRLLLTLSSTTGKRRWLSGVCQIGEKKKNRGSRGVWFQWWRDTYIPQVPGTTGCTGGSQLHVHAGQAYAEASVQQWQQQQDCYTATAVERYSTWVFDRNLPPTHTHPIASLSIAGR